MLADPTLHKQGQNYSVTYGDDSQTFVEFRKEAIHNQAKSDSAGIPLFDEVDFIRIMFPGDKTKIVDRPVNDIDKQRFREQWRAYQETGETPQTGTPITEWPPLTKSQALTLRALGVHTVQQLAGMSDHGLDSFLGARELRERAKVFLQATNSPDATMSKLVAENETMKLDMQALRDQIAALGGDEKRKPGPKPKLAA